MACITGGRRCERILTGGQTALDLWVFLHVSLGLAVVGCERVLSVASLRSEVAGSLLMVLGSLRSAGKFTGSYWYVDPMLAFQPVKSDNLGGGV